MIILPPKSPRHTVNLVQAAAILVDLGSFRTGNGGDLF